MQGCLIVLLVLVAVYLVMEYWPIAVVALLLGALYFVIRHRGKTRLADARAAYISSFVASPEHDLVCRYVARSLAGACDSADISKLQGLLEPTWVFSDDEMLTLIRDEHSHQLEDSVRYRLEASGARSAEEYCLVYLDICHSTQTDYINVLQDVMCRAGVLASATSQELLGMLAQVQRKHELEGFERVLMNPSDDDVYPNLDTLDGLAFEHMLGDLYRKMGYSVEVTRASGDQGADVVVEKLGVKTVVQAKCWCGTVGNTAVQEATAAKRHYGAQHGAVVTTGRFTKGARALAQSNDIELVDREGVEDMLRRYWRQPIL
jgi:hypothetical protein